MTTKTVKRAYRYRFHPTPEQAESLTRLFGCVRLVWNKALDLRQTRHTVESKSTSYTDTSAALTAWKTQEDLSFLLQQTLRHQQNAFTRFFNRTSGYPRFKSRKSSRRSAEFSRSAFRFTDGNLTLAKMSEPLDVVWSRPLPDGVTPTTVTVSQDPAGRWFVSLLCESQVGSLPATDTAVGVDAGITSLVTLSTGEKVTNPKAERADRKRLRKAQQNLSRKKPGSANRGKAKRRVARVHARITDRRRDTLHKLSTRLIRENQTVVIEDLNVAGMLGNHSLARAISDASWATLRSMLEYKADWYGRDLVTVDRFYPSSQLCSRCGHRVGKLPLAVRSWDCPCCGGHHDRDVNAARNILAAGLAER
jgi:putative transposase